VPDPSPDSLAKLDSLLRELGGQVHLMEMKRSSKRDRDRDDLAALKAAHEDADGRE
jgi:hypothetical protein